MNHSTHNEVFRTLLYDSRKLLLPVLTELFGIRYRGNEKIELIPSRFHREAENCSENRETDFCLITGNDGAVSRYHIEYDTDKSGNDLVRILQYDAETDEEGFSMTLGRAGVLVLREAKRLPDVLQLRIRTPGGVSAVPVPVMKTGAFTAAELQKRGLYLLFPFGLFRYEAEFERMENSAADLAELLDCLETLREALDSETADGTMERSVERNITRGILRTAESLKGRYDNIVEAVQNIVGMDAWEGKAAFSQETERMVLCRELVLNLFREGIPISKLTKALQLDADTVSGWIEEL